MISKPAVESLLGPPIEHGETWTTWEASNGIARFTIHLHYRGSADVLLIAGRDLLLWRGEHSLQFFRLLVGLGIVDSNKCVAMADSDG